ncbi:unnamed protein product [Mytilus coruscus]|uniref:C-type lectin domain-containing protein n=1 Tax=Mytilus coruscus TaxID=42192 RepID=A0A6J8AJS8_MYTCO|nr:unnamed protein product [Mytilus coruscus]
MMKGFIFLFPFGLLFVNGTFTCTESDWVLDGSKCYKIILGSPMNGQARCSNEDPNAVLMLAPSKEVATNLVGVLLSEDKIWVGLRFRNGTEWIWDDGSTEIVIWGRQPKVPQLCISVWEDGDMCDRYCYSTEGLICQKEINGSGFCENGWTMFGTLGLCYKRLRRSNSGVNFRDARTICNKENASIMMPKSKSEARTIATSLDCGSKFCWVGITDFDADHTYTWEDGTEESQSNLYFRSSEPDNRHQDYICAYIQNSIFYNGECTEIQRVICEIDAIDNSPTTTAIHFSTEMEDTPAYIQTTVPSSEIKISASTITEVSTSLDSTPLSGSPSKGSGTEINTKYIDKTTEHKYTEQVENVTIIQRKFPVPTVSAYEARCITKCKSDSSQYTNGSVDASRDYLYRVDKKSLSSYRRLHYSAPDSRKSSFYIGSGGIAFLVIFGLFILMLDVLPKT